ncbi:MAG: polysaccharide lyase 6 family protein [Woeseia sp.]|nr:polysaccharide lyase 6 family protein [Woeseia sp.]
MTRKICLIPFILILALAACSQSDNSGSVQSGTAKNGLVTNIEEFDNAVASLQPGDKIILANGTWTDVELRLEATGSADNPIELSAEEPGKVFITGQSNLSISGSHIVVSGLVFKDGFTPTSEVISFRTSKDELANNSRVTNSVIDNFSNPERHDSDTWVAIYGKNNQFDHNSLIGKGNRGVTLAVKMTTEASRENGHVIEYNYFGPRATLGSNGGETLRIGTSHYSRAFSNTIVRNNYFDRTSGELEIISSKSCGNKIRNNVFFESQGTLTMRHGHTTLVENNYFLGNRKPNTGGIRIINEYQTVRNNYLYGLTGHRFRSALVIMNGVPNSPINRYNQVVDSEMNNNIVVDSDNIQLCAGSDAERSATPVGSAMKNNIFMSKTNLNPFTIYDDISGISFEGNVINDEADVPIDRGFSKAPYSVTRNDNGLLVPAQSLIDQIGFGDVKLPVSKEEVGASFYPKVDINVPFQSGNTIPVKAGTNTLLEALDSSKPGDTLLLENGGEYLLTKYAVIRHPITIEAASGDKAMVRSEKQSFFVIENGGSLELANLWIDGAESPDQAGNSVISTSRYSMNRNYSLAIRNCKVTNLDVNHTFNFLKVYKNTFADSIEIVDTEMTNITGSVLSLDKETDDLGIYNVENVVIRNSRFSDIQGSVANIYRGGTDESTFGPIVVVEGTGFTNIGLGNRNKIGASLKFHGVQKLDISDSTWDSSAPLELYLTNGEPITVIQDVVMTNTNKIRANNSEYETKNVAYE